MPIENIKPIPDLTPEEILRVYGHIEIRDKHECWRWKAHCNKAGYPIMWIREVRYRATRLILKIVTGKDPAPLLAIHTCENEPTAIGRSCVNPCHLEAGSHGRNMEFTRGIPRPNLMVKGSANPNSKLREIEVLNIRRRKAAGETLAEIASDYPVGKSMISHICTGRNWKEPTV